MPDQSELSQYFVGAWAILALAGFLMFYRGSTAAFKRRWFRWFVGFSGALFAAYILLWTYPHWQDGMPPLLIFVALPMIAFISYVNIKVTKFCDRCGSSAFPLGGFTPPAQCPKCGAPLR